MKAANLLHQFIGSMMTTDTAPLFFDMISDVMCSCPERDVASKDFRQGYIMIFDALLLKQDAFPATIRYRLITFALYASTRCHLMTDDSYEYSKACSYLKETIEALSFTPNAGQNGSDSDDRNDAGGDDDDGESGSKVDPEEVVERQRVILSCMEEAFRTRSKWAWARQPCDSVFAVASQRRLLFPQDEGLRDNLDDLTTAITLTQRKDTSWSGPKAVRTYNSTAHPLLVKKFDVFK
jgi:hypothetical protein